MSFEAGFGGTDRKWTDEQRNRTRRLIVEIVPVINGEMIKLQSHVVTEHLSGRPGLRHISGKLANSIRVETAHAEGPLLVAGVEGAGGPAWYGKLHETGGIFEVPEHERRIGFSKSGKMVRLLTKGGHVRRQVAEVIHGTVRAHTMNLPQRSFMGSSQDEMREEITTTIQAKIAEVLGAE